MSMPVYEFTMRGDRLGRPGDIQIVLQADSRGRIGFAVAYFYPDDNVAMQERTNTIGVSSLRGALGRRHFVITGRKRVTFSDADAMTAETWLDSVILGL